MTISKKERKNQGAFTKNFGIKSAIQKFEELLTAEKREEEIHNFLKDHTIFIDEFSEMISKQKLGEDFITDIVLKNNQDQGPKYTFVELERPTLKIFTKSQELSSEFQHAYLQTIHWANWLEKSKIHIQTKLIGFESPNYVIIGGRSKNMNNTEKSILRGWNRKQRDTVFYTYDDLLERTKTLAKNVEKYIADDARI